VREKYDYKRDIILTIYNKSCDYYKAPLILGYPRVTHYPKAFLDPTHGYLAKRGPGPRGPMGPTRGFWSSLSQPAWQVVAELEEAELERQLMNSASHMALSRDSSMVAAVY